MAPSPFTPDDPAGNDFRAAVGKAIAGFLDERRAATLQVGAELEHLHRLAVEFTAGGKRLRPALCYWGHVAAAGQPEDPGWLVTTSASLDLLHVSALVHDDVMDSSDIRRGVPAAHRQLERWHAEQGGRGDSAAFGRAGAILLGDLLLVWSTQMFDHAKQPAATRQAARCLIETMRTEVTCGQFLDVVSQARLMATPDDLAGELDRVNRVVDYKSARYSVRHPLEIGAALGGADAATLAALGRFGGLVGRAFQFRDDLLGVFGQEQLTGKPAGDDLREGKRTVLVAHALARATRAAADELDAMLGRPDLDDHDLDRARQVITDSGADQAVEEEIATSMREALTHLAQAQITVEGREALTRLATLATQRAA